VEAYEVDPAGEVEAAARAYVTADGLVPKELVERRSCDVLTCHTKRERNDRGREYRASVDHRGEGLTSR